MVPALGFGTAPMLGRQSRKQSLAALQYAYSRGIRHFDTARSYGWGEAEKLLGEFLRHYPRQDYVLVGKCGIVPPQRTQFLSAIKAIGRNLVRAFPGRRNLVQKIASSAPFAPVRTYDIATLQESVDTTFRELNCSYLDVLLLHNFDPAFEGLHDIIAWMRKLQAQGVIRRFGVSVEGDLFRALETLDHYGLIPDCVVQTPVNDALFRLPRRWCNVQFIAHSPFRYLGATNPAMPFSDLLTRLAESCRCEAVVCSMYSLHHIDENLNARSLAERSLLATP